jgi:hypothetical protein
MLEALDLRIVPSAVAAAPTGHAVAAEHASVAGSNHSTSVHHRTTVDHHAVVHHAVVHHAKVHHAQPDYPAPINYPAPSTNTGSTTVSTTPTSTSTSTSITGSSTSVTAASPTASAPAQTRGIEFTTAAGASGASQGQTTGDTVTAAAAIPFSPTTTAPTTTTTATNVGDTQNGPLAKAGNDLITIYQEFEDQGGSSTFTSSKAGVIRIQGGNVDVDINTAGSNFSQFVSMLTSLGLQVQSQDATHGIVEGYLPIGQLPTVAQNPQTESIAPVYIAKTY